MGKEHLLNRVFLAQCLRINGPTPISLTSTNIKREIKKHVTCIVADVPSKIYIYFIGLVKCIHTSFFYHSDPSQFFVSIILVHQFSVTLRDVIIAIISNIYYRNLVVAIILCTISRVIIIFLFGS